MPSQSASLSSHSPSQLVVTGTVHPFPPSRRGIASADLAAGEVLRNPDISRHVYV